MVAIFQDGGYRINKTFNIDQNTPELTNIASRIFLFISSIFCFRSLQFKQQISRCQNLVFSCRKGGEIGSLAGDIVLHT